MIELKNIDVTFQNGSHEFKAVDNVSLKINKGRDFWNRRTKWCWKEYSGTCDQFVTETNEWRSDH